MSLLSLANRRRRGVGFARCHVAGPGRCAGERLLDHDPRRTSTLRTPYFMGNASGSDTNKLNSIDIVVLRHNTNLPCGRPPDSCRALQANTTTSPVTYARRRFHLHARQHLYHTTAPAQLTVQLRHLTKHLARIAVLPVHDAEPPRASARPIEREAVYRSQSRLFLEFVLCRASGKAAGGAISSSKATTC